MLDRLVLYYLPAGHASTLSFTSWTDWYIVICLPVRLALDQCAAYSVGI